MHKLKKILDNPMPGKYGRRIFLEGQSSVGDQISTRGHFLRESDWLSRD